MKRRLRLLFLLAAVGIAQADVIGDPPPPPPDDGDNGPGIITNPFPEVAPSLAIELPTAAPPDVFLIEPTETPEPATYVLTGLGLIAVFAIRRK